MRPIQIKLQIVSSKNAPFVHFFSKNTKKAPVAAIIFGVANERCMDTNSISALEQPSAAMPSGWVRTKRFCFVAAVRAIRNAITCPVTWNTLTTGATELPVGTLPATFK